jgi:hypothetical protein
MPHKDPEKKRAYHREYLRRRREAVKPGNKTVLCPTEEAPRHLDRTRPYSVESRYPYPAYLVQDGLWFDPATGQVVGVVH